MLLRRRSMLIMRRRRSRLITLRRRSRLIALRRRGRLITLKRLIVNRVDSNRSYSLRTHGGLMSATTALARAREGAL